MAIFILFAPCFDFELEFLKKSSHKTSAKLELSGDLTIAPL